MSAAVWDVANPAGGAMKLISVGDGWGEWYASKALARCGVRPRIKEANGITN